MSSTVFFLLSSQFSLIQFHWEEEHFFCCGSDGLFVFLRKWGVVLLPAIIVLVVAGATENEFPLNVWG